MPELNRSDDTVNLGPGQLTINQGDFREQQDVIGDSLLQLGGRGEVGPGETVNNPLNAPFVLYVNPYIGQDTIAFGNYATNDDDLEQPPPDRSSAPGLRLHRSSPLRQPQPRHHRSWHHHQQELSKRRRQHPL